MANTVGWREKIAAQPFSCQRDFSPKLSESRRPYDKQFKLRRVAKFVVLSLIMLMKVFAALISLFVLSGCCELFGICTSVAVHTSADSPNKYVRANDGDPRLVQLDDSSPYLTLISIPDGEPPVLSASSPARCTQKSG